MNVRNRMLALLAATATLTIGLQHPAQASTQESRCRDVTIPVAIAPGQPTQYHIWGELCTPSRRPATTVQVLLHGLNYSHLYWDFPLRRSQYSYTRWANKAGYATFNIDRIGIGNSSHPSSSTVTLESNAFTVHQVVNALRGGRTWPRFRQVVLVGHSFGSEIAKLTASTYGGVNALVLTGSGRNVSPSGSARAGQLGQPVAEVPRLAARIPAGDLGYVTVQDASRTEIMYSVPDADPKVIALDIATKETNTMPEIFTIGNANLPGVTERIRVPVLIINGAKDRLVCAPDAMDCTSGASIEAIEQPFFPATKVDAAIVADAGHVINLHLNASVAYRVITDWINQKTCALR